MEKQFNVRLRLVNREFINGQTEENILGNGKITTWMEKENINGQMVNITKVI